MATIQVLTSFKQIKLLADPHRLAVLRALLAAPATLTQLGQQLGKHPAWIRHHLKQLEANGIVEICRVQVTNGVTEKFYQASASAFIIQKLIAPQNARCPTVLFWGSHDLAVEALAEELAGIINLVILPVGSLDGLVALRQGLCHLAGSHLLDRSGQYNTPFVQHLFPDRRVLLVTLAQREQGLLLAPGNPHGIRGLADLARPSLTFINRQRGSGTRLWLDARLEKVGIPAERIRGYENTAATHTECAQQVQTGAANAAVGLKAAAAQFGLDFIPLFHERYDLTVPEEHLALVQPVLDAIQTARFRQNPHNLHGYDLTHSGEQIPL